MPRAAAKKTAPLPIVEAVAPAPTAPSPAVLSLQASIVTLVDERTQYRKAITAAQSEVYQAQARLQAATGELQSHDQEIQYRMTVIAQMENRQPSNVVSIAAPAYSMDLSAFSSAPSITPQQNFGGSDPNDQVNRGHASRSMI